MNPNPTSTVDNLNDDPYAISQEDAARIKEENERKASNRAKVKWHSLPKGEGISNWRILPFIKRRTFFVKVSKHFGVPGLNGSVTCPRSFEDPANPGRKYTCAICEKFFEMLKSKEPGDVALAKQVLKQSTSYYANAVSLDHPEEGIGVLNMPYAVWNTLYEWLDIPEYREFSHPKRGRNFRVKAKTVAGTQIPNGKPGQEKRDYVVIPDPSTTAIQDDEWLNQLYDLDAILGVPTYDFTKSCLEKILTGDPTAGQLPQGTPFYIGQLTAPQETKQEEEDDFYTVRPVAPPAFNQVKSINEIREEVSLPSIQASPLPKFAEVGPTTASTPSTVVGADNHRICFGKAFDETNKICLKCPEIDACETKVLQAAREARKNNVESVPVAAATSNTQSEEEIRNMMLKALNKRK